MERIYLKNSDGAYLTNAAGLFLYRKLPDTYQELEYIANTSTAFINTGIAAANKLFKLDLQFTSDATRQLMGISGSSSAYWGNNKGTWEKIGNSQGVDTLARCVVNYDVGNITASRVTTWIEGSTSTYTGTDSSFATASASPFRVFNLAGGSYNCIMKLFGLKVYNATGVLLNAFIPCKRLSDSAIGMYDLMTHTFVASSSSAVFTAGPVASALPAEYQEVNYIQATGTQYIDTEYVLKSNNVKMELNTAWTGTTASTFATYVGFMPSGTTPRFGLHNYSSKIMHGMNATISVNHAVDKDTHLYVLVGNGSTQNLTIDGVTYASSSSYDISSNTLSMTLFARRTSASTVGNYMAAKIFSFKLWANGVLVRNCIPCYRISDGVIGMYDAVTNNFYINKGTGSFTKGTNV